MSMILIGFMASGKSSVARLLDEHFIDTDVLIANRFGLTVAEYFARHGEAAFRKREEEVLALLTASVPADNIVLSPSGRLVAGLTDERSIACVQKALSERLSRAARISTVISTGGGIVLSSKNQTLLSRQPVVIYLQADYETVLARIRRDGATRPIFEKSSSDDFRQLYDSRIPLYERIATVTIATDDQTPSAIATQILAQFPEK